MTVRDDSGISRVFIYGLGTAVMIAWFACVATQIITNGAFQTPFAVHGLMGTVVGSVFGDVALRRAAQKRGDDGGS